MQFSPMERKYVPKTMRKDKIDTLVKQVESDDKTQSRKAFLELCHAAKMGYMDANYLLGICYREGMGTEPSHDAFLNHMITAAEGNFMEAQVILGLYYLQGDRPKQQNLYAAERYLKMAIENDSDVARTYLGLYYMHLPSDDSRIPLGEPLLKEAAEHDYPMAMFEYGYLCYDNCNSDSEADSDTNLEKAEYWIRRAAKAGLADAQNFLGTAYITDIFPNDDHQKGFTWLMKAAEQENAVAMFHLGDYYYRGVSCKPDVELGKKWLKKSADLDYVEAKFALAIITLNENDPHSQAFTDARNVLIKLAEEENFVPAQLEIGEMYLSMQEEEILQSIETDELNTDFWDKAFQMFQRAAKAGSPEGMNMLGRCYTEGFGTKIDRAKAYECYKKASELGNVSAMFNRGECLYSGEGTKENPEEAFIWLKKAAEGDVPVAHYFLGNCYRYGKGTEMDLKKAEACYRKAAEQGHTESMLVLGLVEYYEDDDPENAQELEEEAVRMFRRAAEMGMPEAKTYYAITCMDTGKTEEALDWVKKAVADGEPEGMYTYGSWLHFGTNGIAIDDGTAFDYLERAARMGNYNAQFALAISYSEGESVNIEHDEAMEWLIQAAEHGSADAACALGNMFLDDSDTPSALAWYQSAATDGNAQAMYMIGTLLYKGDGSNSDAKAVKWFLRAANAGHEEAMYMLGVCYLDGQGVEADDQTAEYWLRKAAKAGIDEAKMLLMENFPADDIYDEEDPETDW